VGKTSLFQAEGKKEWARKGGKKGLRYLKENDQRPPTRVLSQTKRSGL